MSKRQNKPKGREESERVCGRNELDEEHKDREKIGSEERGRNRVKTELNRETENTVEKPEESG